MPKVIVNLSHKGRQAFKLGFLKGLGAPAMLFGSHCIDSSISDYEFKALPARRHGSLQGDWLRVGSEIRAAAKRG